MKILKYLHRQSIWGPGAIPPEALVYRRSRRIYLPLSYALVVVGGLTAAINGIPTIDALFPDATADFVGYLFAATGICALLGEVWHRLWRIEMWALSAQTGLLAAYAIALIIRVFTPSPPGMPPGLGHAPGTGFVSVLALMVIILPLIRIDVLAVEQRITRAITRLDAEEDN